MRKFCSKMLIFNANKKLAIKNCNGRYWYEFIRFFAKLNLD